MKPSILLFGMPRSGTTWIGKLFDSHPDTLYRHEPDSVRRLEMSLFPEKKDAPRYRDELEQFIAALPQMRSPEVVGKQPLMRKNYQSAIGLAAYRASVLFAKTMSRIHRHFPCPYRPTAEGYAQARLVWKSIESPGRLGVCIDALSEARAVHLLRHPCGYVASMLRGQASGRFAGEAQATGNRWLLKLLLSTPAGKKLGVGVDELARQSPEERLAWIWVLTQEKILTDVADNMRVLTVRYEDVCAEPYEMTRRMFEFAGLDWQAQSEQFVLTSTRTGSADYYSVFKNSQESAERWRSELAPEAMRRVLRILRGSSLHRFYQDEPATAAIPEAAS